MTLGGAMPHRWVKQRSNDRGARTGALILGGNYRGLGVVRSLGRRGIPVWVLTDEHILAATSRYCRRRLPWPEGGDAKQLDFLYRLCDRHGLQGWVLFPTRDDDAGLIARHHETLSKRYLLTTPPWQVVRWAYDKRLTYQLAGNLGLDLPRTLYPESREAVAALDWTFPVILKPAIKEGFNAFVHSKAWLVEDQSELVARYDKACTFVPSDVIMVQELIPGGGETQFSYAALCRQGDVLASIVARRTRQYPIDFGRSSSYVETVECPEIMGPSQRLLAAMGFTGLVEVEFKLDLRDGRYKLLDVNPRVWGWHSLAQRAGVDFPYLLWRMVHGEEVPETKARSGVRWVRAVTDLPAVAAEIRHGRLSLASYLRSMQGPLEFAILAPDDPLPALAEVPLLSLLALKRRAA